MAWIALGSAAAGGALVWTWLRPGKMRPTSTADRLTATWTLAELGTPLLVARDIDVDVPTGSRLVVSGVVPAQAFQAGQVRQVPHVAADYAVDSRRGRALLFLGGVRSDALALTSQDAALVSRLAAEGEALWLRATPYVEQRALADAPTRLGVPLEVQGVVTEVHARQGSYLIRLEDHGQSLGVKAPADVSELKGQRVLVRGQMDRDGGYPVLVATDVRRLE